MNVSDLLYDIIRHLSYIPFSPSMLYYTKLLCCLPLFNS